MHFFATKNIVICYKISYKKIIYHGNNGSPIFHLYYFMLY